MKKSWSLFYKDAGQEGVGFAELMSGEGGATLRKGNVFTMGKVTPVKSVEKSAAALVASGYVLTRQWTYDTKNKDYQTFTDELKKVIEADPGFKDANALAIITDSSLMTVGIALNRFEDIDEAADEELWSPTEWPQNKDWRGDIAYRWLLGHGFLCEEEEDEDEDDDHRDKVIGCMKDVLKSYKKGKDVLLIAEGGDDWGQRESVECMSKKMSKRLLKWLG
jgi:hypothetical protein